MANPNPHVTEFISLFSQTARYQHCYEVFRDFVQMPGFEGQWNGNVR